MNKENNDIRMKAMECNVKLWQVADKLGIHYVTLNSWLRKELEQNKKDEIIKIIEQIREEEENENQNYQKSNRRA